MSFTLSAIPSISNETLQSWVDEFYGDVVAGILETSTDVKTDWKEQIEPQFRAFYMHKISGSELEEADGVEVETDLVYHSVIPSSSVSDTDNYVSTVTDVGPEDWKASKDREELEEQAGILRYELAKKALYAKIKQHPKFPKSSIISILVPVGTPLVSLRLLISRLRRNNIPSGEDDETEEGSRGLR